MTSQLTEIFTSNTSLRLDDLQSLPVKETGLDVNSKELDGIKKFTSNFTVEKDGVYWKDPEETDKPKQPVKVCSALNIIAEVRDDKNGNWGRLLQWKDKDGVQHEWICPAEVTVSRDFQDAVKELASKGLWIGSNMTHRLREYILNFKPTQRERIRCVDRVGWHGDQYVLPNQVLGLSRKEQVRYLGSDESDFSQSGTLKQWRDNISVHAIGNTRLTFAISLAFAGVLAEMAGESGGGFHFVGTTSKGKTSTLLDPAASVWGNPDKFSKKWRSTANGIELLCASRNDGLLILDELAQIDPREAARSAYLIANGQAKSRMTKECRARSTATWRTLFISAGEISLSQHIEEGGGKCRGGQNIRMPSIPCDAGAGLGTFDTLNSFTNGRIFSEHLKTSTRLYYGTAGAEFLRRLTERAELVRIRRVVDQDMVTMLSNFRIPAGAAPEVGRVAQRFALVACAGELASYYRITGWSNGETTKAAVRCFNDWLDDSGSGSGSDDIALLEQVAQFFQRHADSRFVHIDYDNKSLPCRDRVGFSEIVEGVTRYIVLPESVDEIIKGYRRRDALRVLIKHGYIVLAANGEPTQRRSIKAIDGVQRRVYVFSGKAFGGN